jgi:tetratricopeptide (TPR) repeat protein
MGDVLVAQGDGPGALAAYQAGLAIREGLAKRDPANTAWQRDLSLSKDRIGDVLVAQGDGAGALAAYQAGLAIREGLAKRDPANTGWQRDLVVSNNKIGNALRMLRYGPAALKAYQASLEISETLTKRDPDNTQWQVDLAISYFSLGTLENLLAPSNRRAHLQRGLDILLRLKQAGRLHANQDITASFEKEIQKLDAAPPILWAGLKPP